MNSIEKNNKNLFDKDPIEAGYIAPKGYFDTIEDVFSMKLQEENFPKGNAYRVPEGYFNRLEDSILSKVELPKKGKVISLRKRLIQWIPASAAACIFVFIALNTDPGLETETFTNDELTLWFDNNVTDITNDDLSIAFEGIELNQSSLLEDTFENEDIVEYLSTEDTSLLFEETTILENEIN
ncbi:MAG: hypothetical protein JXR05_04100 [Flavobacteriaceae bacterium]